MSIRKANYETWAMQLWINNDEGGQQYWATAAQEAWNEAVNDEINTRSFDARYNLAERLRDESLQAKPEIYGVWGDFLNAALKEIDWEDIANNLLEGIGDDEDNTEREFYESSK